MCVLESCKPDNDEIVVESNSRCVGGYNSARSSPRLETWSS